jgi:hypothetical protein
VAVAGSFGAPSSWRASGRTCAWPPWPSTCAAGPAHAHGVSTADRQRRRLAGQRRRHSLAGDGGPPPAPTGSVARGRAHGAASSVRSDGAKAAWPVVGDAAEEPITRRLLRRGGSTAYGRRPTATTTATATPPRRRHHRRREPRRRRRVQHAARAHAVAGRAPCRPRRAGRPPRRPAVVLALVAAAALLLLEWAAPTAGGRL